MVNERDIIDSKKMTSEELEAEIELWMTKGKDIEVEPGKVDHVIARSRNSAVNKIVREISQESVGMEDVEGYFLEVYKPLRRGGVSCYLGTPTDGVIKVDIESIPSASLGQEPDVMTGLRITHVERFRNVFAEGGKTWLKATSGSKIIPVQIGVPFLRCVSPISDIVESGLYAVSGAIMYVNEKSEFVEAADGKRVPTEPLPVLDKSSKVNLRLTIKDRTGQASVGIPDVVRLKNLIGDDFKWLHEDGAVKELADMLRGYDVVVFGRASKYFSEGKADQREVNPYFNLSTFGWILIPTADEPAEPEPAPPPESAAAEPGDDDRPRED